MKTLIGMEEDAPFFRWMAKNANPVKEGWYYVRDTKHQYDTLFWNGKEWQVPHWEGDKANMIPVEKFSEWLFIRTIHIK